MFSSIIRVVARSAAIQLEEVAARSTAPTYLNKGKGRAVEPELHPDETPIRKGDRLDGFAESSASGGVFEPIAGERATSQYPDHLGALYRQSTTTAHPSRAAPSASGPKPDRPPAGSSRSALLGASLPYPPEATSSSAPLREHADRSAAGPSTNILHNTDHRATLEYRLNDQHSEASSATVASHPDYLAAAPAPATVASPDQIKPIAAAQSSVDDRVAGASLSPAQADTVASAGQSDKSGKLPSLSESAEILGAVSIDQVIDGISASEELQSQHKQKPASPQTVSVEAPAESQAETAVRSAQPDQASSANAEHTDTGLTPEDTADETPVILRASKVPSTKIGRFLHYGSLAASLSWGAASETLKRSTGGGSSGSVFMSDANVRRLVASLTRMRGAALKLGQFMSIQDNHMLPPEIERVLQQVQAHANYMPDWQMERVMTTELGSDWSNLFRTFDRTPIASASIGQVHRATLHTGEEVAVKIQFPGIRDSITSDLSYLTPLLASSSILPKGLYLQNTIATMKRELADECDYTMEAEAGRRFGRYLARDAYFDVPKVIDEACTERVLTTAWMGGKPLSRMKGMSQATRDKIGTNILRLCLQELFHFRFMQTDPNWANFLYSPQQDRLGLIDFGASREYTKEFMDGWFALLSAALRGDRGVMKEQSEKIGYFTGEEEEVMIDAHLSSMSLLAEPFSYSGTYDFANQTITNDVRKYIPIMLKHRLTPPPPETYSLNRKLSGAFLMCARLGARVDCGKLWADWAAEYPYPTLDD